VRTVGFFLQFAVTLACLSGCERAILEGRAVNARGEALPGVVVRLEGTSRQDLTDGLGRYRLPAPRDASKLSLRMSKTGYAPTLVDLTPTGRILMDVPDTPLWILPLNAGVFEYKDQKYIAAEWALPKEYSLKDGETEFGLEVRESLAVEMPTNALWLVCYRTPRYNARLTRLVEVEAVMPGANDETVPIWVESGTIAVGLEPMDHPDGLLQRVVVDRPLQPGIYAVHWGAIEGYTTLESRVYVLRLVEPPAPEPAVEVTGPPSDATIADHEADAIEPPAEIADPQ